MSPYVTRCSDVNKLRFMSELDEQVKGTSIDVYWDSNATSYAAYLEAKELQGWHPPPLQCVCEVLFVWHVCRPMPVFDVLLFLLPFSL
jgi:hypothetical protein